MSLYRNDFHSPDGRVTPMRDPVLGGDFLTRSRSYARAMARIGAAATGETVVCTRIYGAGSMRESFRVTV
jgi:hypothetical protein